MSDELQATFDYSNYSRADQKRSAMLQLDIQFLSAQLDENMARLSRKDYDAMKAEYLALTDEVEQAVVAYVTHVPPEWFVSDAPSNISIDTPDWWLYVRADKLREIKQAAAEARQPAAVSGN